MTSFSSLLEQFSLQSRLVTLDSIRMASVWSPIPWETVYDCLDKLRLESFSFLEESLSGGVKNNR